MMISPGMRRVVAITALTLCSALICLGQEPISGEVWERYHRDAQKAFRATPYRIKITIEDRKSEDEPWQPYSESTMEIIARLPSYRSHFLGQNLETIQIDKIEYTKQKDGTWSRKDLEKERQGGTVRVVERGTTNYSKLSPQNSYARIRQNDNTIVLQMESQYKIEYLRDGMVYEHHDIKRVWFDDRGRIIKTESLTYEPRRQIFIRRQEEFEYDESIRIEAPISESQN